MKIDIEEVEKKILAIVQDKLPAKLTEINTDKGDSLLTPIDNSNYLDDFYQAELTPKQFIFYGIKDPELESVSYDSSQTWTVFYQVFLEQRNDLSTVRSKILRYTRALKEVIQDNVDAISLFCSTPEIINLTPQDVQDIISDTPYKMGGIELKITIS